MEIEEEEEKKEPENVFLRPKDCLLKQASKYSLLDLRYLIEDCIRIVTPIII